MRPIPHLLIALSLTGPGLVAQDEMQRPTPPEELAKFDRMLGTWKGAGTTTMAPGAPATEWTAESHIRKALDGFFLQEEMVINLGPMVPAPLVFRSFIGFDREQQKYMSCGISSMGRTTASEIHWADDDTMVSIDTNIEDGQVVVDRWVTRLSSDGFSFVGHRAIGGGDFFVHVEGSMKRSNEIMQCPPLEAAVGFSPAGEEMSRLNRMAGRYQFKGSYTMNPGDPSMEISGNESMVPIFGGNGLMLAIKGDPMPVFGVYEAWAAFSWDPVRKCYASIFVNNMGEIGTSEARWVGDNLVSIHSQTRAGVPSVSRGVLTFDDKGAVRSAVSHSMVAGHAPAKEFEGTYTRQRD